MHLKVSPRCRVSVPLFHPSRLYRNYSSTEWRSHFELFPQYTFFFHAFNANCLSGTRCGRFHLLHLFIFFQDATVISVPIGFYESQVPVSSVQTARNRMPNRRRRLPISLTISSSPSLLDATPADLNTQTRRERNRAEPYHFVAIQWLPQILDWQRAPGRTLPKDVRVVHAWSPFSEVS